MIEIARVSHQVRGHGAGSTVTKQEALYFAPGFLRIDSKYAALTTGAGGAPIDRPNAPADMSNVRWYSESEVVELHRPIHAPTRSPAGSASVSKPVGPTAGTLAEAWLFWPSALKRCLDFDRVRRVREPGELWIKAPCAGPVETLFSIRVDDREKTQPDRIQWSANGKVIAVDYLKEWGRVVGVLLPKTIVEVTYGAEGKVTARTTLRIKSARWRPGPDRSLFNVRLPPRTPVSDRRLVREPPREYRARGATGILSLEELKALPPRGRRESPEGSVSRGREAVEVGR